MSKKRDKRDTIIRMFSNKIKNKKSELKRTAFLILLIFLATILLAGADNFADNFTNNFTNISEPVTEIPILIINETNITNITQPIPLPECLNDSDCDDNNPLTLDYCRDNICSYIEVECINDSDCNDNNNYTIDFCRDNLCSYLELECLYDLDCDDNNQSTQDLCIDNFCVYQLIQQEPPEPECQVNEDCNDENDYTIDSCIDNFCSHTEIECVNDSNCNDNNETTIDFCIENECVYELNESFTILSNEINVSLLDEPSGINISDCGDLTSAGYYNLTADVSSAGNCFNINADNIVLDCAGYTINYSVGSTTAERYGINNTGGFDNLTVQNCIIGKQTTGNWNNAIKIVNSDNSTFINNTLDTYYGAAYYIATSNNVQIHNSTSYTLTYGHGIYFSSSDNGMAIGNNLTYDGPAYYSAYSAPIGIATSQNLTIKNNRLNASNTHSLILHTATDSDANHTIVNNLADGLPIKYWAFNSSVTVANEDWTGFGDFICARCSDVTFDGVSFGNHGLSIVSSTSRITIANSTINTTTPAGFDLHYADYSHIINNSFYNKAGIYISQRAHNSIIKDNFFNLTANGVGTLSSGGLVNNVTIDNNVILTYEDNIYGLYLYPGSNLLLPVKITNNFINTSGQSSHGIYLIVYGYEVEMSNNSVYVYGTGSTFAYYYYYYYQCPWHASGYATLGKTLISDSYFYSKNSYGLYITDQSNGVCGTINMTNVTYNSAYYGAGSNANWTINNHWYLDAQVNYTNLSLVIGNVYLYNNLGAITHNETIGVGAVKDGLIGYWNMDECTGTTLYDKAVGSVKNDITLNGGSYTTGKYGCSYDFYEGNYVSGDQNINYLHTGTLSVWVKINGSYSNKYPTILGIGTGVASSAEMAIFDYAGGKFLVNSDDVYGGSYLEICGGGLNSTYAKDEWVHLAVTWDGARLRTYCNGTDYYSHVTYTQIGDLITDGNVVIGGSSGYAFGNYSIDEARIYDRALSPTEIKQLWEKGSNSMTRQVEVLEYTQNATRKYPQTNYTMNATDGTFWSNETVEFNLTSNNISNDKIQLYLKDTIPPNVTLNSPSNGTIVSAYDYRTFNCSATNDQLTNITFYLWNSSALVQINSSAVTGTSNSTAFNYTFSYEDTFFWNCKAYDFDENSAFATLNNTITSNLHPTTPTNLECNNENCSQNRSFANTIALNCSGSTDAAGDDITYAIEANYTLNSPPTGSHLLFHLDNNSAYGETSTIIHDFSNEGNDGTAYNGAIPTATGKYDGGFYFDGSNDQVTAPLSFNGNLTMEVWVKYEGIPNDASQYDWYALTTKSAHDGDFGIMQEVKTSSKRLILWVGGTTIVQYTFSDIANSVWYHVAITFNGTTGTIYINGTQKAQTRTPATLQDNYNIVYIGRSSSGYYRFKGTMDELIIYNRTLSAAEVLDHYQNGPVGLSTGFQEIGNHTAGNTYSWDISSVDEMRYLDFRCRATDVQGSQNYSAYFTAGSDVRIDRSKPEIDSLQYIPNSTDDLDPNRLVSFEINVSDSVTGANSNINSSIAHVVLQYTTTGLFSNQTMEYNSATGYYEANFTPTANEIYTVRVWANDTVIDLPNVNTSSNTTLTIKYDWNWTWTTDFNDTTVSGTFESNKIIGNLTINNTGDDTLIFTSSDTCPYGDFGCTFNGSDSIPTVSLASNASYDWKKSLSYIINATFGTVAREDEVYIRLFASPSVNATPVNVTINFTLASYAGGPYHDLRIDSYNTTIYQSSNESLSALLRNLGNETSQETNVSWSLPSGISIVDGNATHLMGDLSSGDNNRSSLNVSIASTATAGYYNITARSYGYNSNLANDTYSVSITIQCNSNDSVCGTGCSYDTSSTFYDPDCSAPSSGGGDTSTSGGGGGGGGGAPELEAEDTFEIRIGQTKNFNLSVLNDYAGPMQDITLEYETDYPIQYISYKSPFQIPRNETGDITIIITAPKYLTKQNYDITFTITANIIEEQAQVDKPLVKFSITQERKFIIAVHEISREDILDLIAQAEKKIEEIKNLSIGTSKLEATLEKAKREFDDEDFETSASLCEEIISLANTAIDVKNRIQELEKKIEDAERQGIKMPETKRILNLAQIALDREAFDLALSRIKDAEYSYALEFKGEFNVIFWVYTHPIHTLIYLMAALIILYFLYHLIVYIKIRYELSNLIKEKDVLMGLMREVQKDAFERGKMSMEEYVQSMLQYESRLSIVVQRTIDLETAKVALLKPKLKKLELERKKILDLIKETQEEYIKKGMQETRIYQNRMKSYIARLTEVEEDLIVREANKTIRKSRLQKLNIFRRLRKPKEFKKSKRKKIKFKRRKR